MFVSRISYWFLTHGNWELLHSKKNVIRALPVLFSSFVPESSFPGVPSVNSLSNWKFALLKFRALTVLHLAHIPKIVNSTRAWPLQLRLPPVLTSSISSSVLVGSRSINASPLGVLSVTRIKKLSPTHSRSLLDCLQIAVLLFQQMSQWLESPSRVKACEHDASCCWSKNSSSTSSPCLGSL